MPRPIAFVIVAVAIAFELSVVWFMLHPQVSPDYRAYYIAKTTTCLNQPVPGTYIIGTTVSFRSDGRESAMPLRVCGWEGPAGDGTHAVGESSRLRFALPDAASGQLQLTLEVVAVEREGHPSQRIVLEANGVPLGTATAMAGTPLTLDVPVPQEALAGEQDALDIVMSFPDAIRMSPADSNTRYRSIKLISARLATMP